MSRPSTVVTSATSDRSLWIRSPLFDHGLLGLPLRKRSGQGKDLVVQNLATMASALVDFSSGKDWVEICKDVCCIKSP